MLRHTEIPRQHEISRQLIVGSRQSQESQKLGIQSHEHTNPFSHHSQTKTKQKNSFDTHEQLPLTQTQSHTNKSQHILTAYSFPIIQSVHQQKWRLRTEASERLSLFLLDTGLVYTRISKSDTTGPIYPHIPRHRLPGCFFTPVSA